MMPLNLYKQDNRACFETSGQIKTEKIQRLFKCNLTCDKAGNSRTENVPISVS